MTTAQTQTGTADDFFDGIGGGGAASFKFGGVGTGIKGTVVDQYRTFVTEPGSREPKTYPDSGEPIPQLNVTLQTDLRNWDKVTKIPTDADDNPLPASEDDGKRRIFIKYDMRRAVGVALRQAGEKALAEGGILAVKHTGEKSTGKANGLPLYEARYQAPPKNENADLWAGMDESPAAPAAAPATAAAAPAPTAADDEPPF